MPTTHGLAILFSALATVASAQTPCHAAVRDLASPTARTQLDDITRARAPSRDVMADGAACAKDSLKTRVWEGWFGVVDPTVRIVDAGGVPDPRNGGGMWTGLGLNAFARVGITFDRGMVHGIFAPEAWYSQNSAFTFFSSSDSTRSPFASPWYSGRYSMDLPTRMGATSLSNVALGQSALWVSTHGADFGVSSSSQAWGPGVRGHLLLGPDAPGIPRAFVRTTKPLVTRAGAFSGTAFIGTLTESPFFDNNPANDLRTITAWTVSWSPSDSSGTAVGVAHAGMRTGSPWGGSAHKLQGPTDQLNTIFVRFKSPNDGLRAWAEVGHQGALPSARQFFTVPYQGIAYLYGLSTGIRSASGTLLFTGEGADLEQPTDIRGQQTQDFYTSADIPQGWTQRGQLLGDGIGPGGQSQWFSMDWITPTRSTGVFLERVRWNEDAFFRQYLPYLNRHDVTVRVGLRGDGVYRDREISVELSSGRRLNYLFQNGTYIPGYHTVDVNVSELRVSITPLASRGP